MKTAPQKLILLLLFFLTMSTAMFAAPGDPPPPTPPPPPGLPIDSGIIFLVIIGLLYGLYKVKNYSLQSK